MPRKKPPTIKYKIRMAKEPFNVEIDDVLYIGGHTLLPPTGDYDPAELKEMKAYISDFDLIKLRIKDKEIPANEARILLHCRYGQFTKTKNPVYAIEAFLIAHKAGLYPPMWVMNFMADVFMKYHDSQGTARLERLFGFSRKKGQTTAFMDTVNYDRDESLMFFVGTIKCVFGCSVDEAAHMVARKLEDMPYSKYNSGVLKINKLSEETLKDKYNKEWYKLYSKDVYFQRHCTGWSEEKKKSFLQGYPDDCVPERLKHFLK